MAHTIICQDLLESLSEYLDGSLSDNLCAELERHLATCENCQVVLNTTRKTIELYHGEAKQPLPDEVRRRLYCCLDLEDFLSEKPPRAESGDPPAGG